MLTYQGRIERCFPEHHFGFIFRQDGTEVYFDFEALQNMSVRALSKGLPVVFGEVDSADGPTAVWVKPRGEGDPP